MGNTHTTIMLYNTWSYLAYKRLPPPAKPHQSLQTPTMSTKLSKELPSKAYKALLSLKMEKIQKNELMGLLNTKPKHWVGLGLKCKLFTSMITAIKEEKKKRGLNEDLHLALKQIHQTVELREVLTEPVWKVWKQQSWASDQHEDVSEEEEPEPEPETEPVDSSSSSSSSEDEDEVKSETREEEASMEEKSSSSDSEDEETPPPRPKTPDTSYLPPHGYKIPKKEGLPLPPSTLKSLKEGKCNFFLCSTLIIYLFIYSRPTQANSHPSQPSYDERR